MKIASARQLDKIWMYFAPLFVILTGLDQLTKAWAVSALESFSRKKIGFVLNYNDGIVFGFDVPDWLIYTLTALIVGMGTYLVVENKLWRDRWHLTGLAMLLAGAIGNLIDRVRFGYVIDFIKIYWWPTFNLADVFIVAAVVLFAWEFLIRENAISEI